MTGFGSVRRLVVVGVVTGVVILAWLGSMPSRASAPVQCVNTNASDQPSVSPGLMGDAIRPRLVLLQMDAAQRNAPRRSSGPSNDLAQTVSRAEALLNAGYPLDALKLLSQIEQKFAQYTQARTPAGQDNRLAARSFNIYGRALADTGNQALAIGRFDQSADIAESGGNTGLLARALLNGLRARINTSELGGFDAHLERARTAVLDVGGDGVLPLQLAELFHRAVSELAFPQTLLEQSDALIALATADGTKNDRLLFAQAAGLRGAVAETRGNLRAALEQTRRAIAQAQSADSVSQVFRWQWQFARLARAAGKNEEALEALRDAVFLLEEFRTAVVPPGSDSYQTWVDPVYRAYADLLLLDAPQRSGAAQQLELRRIRALLESLKKAEVEDYFSNECFSSGAADKSLATAGRAVLYPLLFANRLELLLEVNGDLMRTSVAIDRASVIREVRKLRLNLERPESREDYLPQAQRVYSWLIAPIKEALAAANVETLILVPDGALRTIPFSALHSGEEYLVEQYALATTPAVGLTSSADDGAVGNRNSRRGNILAGGLTQSVQGFSALPGVDTEMTALVGQHNASEIRDEAFRLEAVSSGLVSPAYSVVHLATHGEFSADHRNSFLLTFDDRLRLPALKTLLDGRANDQLDLLVLSACQSAAGDDEAALGLAGIAVQSGARSAVASLWSISDTSTAELFSVFYSELRSGGANKAESLRRAQLSLLRDERFAHPSYWAPYLLIGQAI